MGMMTQIQFLNRVLTVGVQVTKQRSALIQPRFASPRGPLNLQPKFDIHIYDQIQRTLSRLEVIGGNFTRVVLKLNEIQSKQRSLLKKSPVTAQARENQSKAHFSFSVFLNKIEEKARVKFTYLHSKQSKMPVHSVPPTCHSAKWSPPTPGPSPSVSPPQASCTCVCSSSLAHLSPHSLTLRGSCLEAPNPLQSLVSHHTNHDHLPRQAASQCSQNPSAPGWQVGALRHSPAISLHRHPASNLQALKYSDKSGRSATLRPSHFTTILPPTYKL